MGRPCGSRGSMGSMLDQSTVAPGPHTSRPASFVRLRLRVSLVEEAVGGVGAGGFASIRVVSGVEGVGCGVGCGAGGFQWGASLGEWQPAASVAVVTTKAGASLRSMRQVSHGWRALGPNDEALTRGGNARACAGAR